MSGPESSPARPMETSRLSRAPVDPRRSKLMARVRQRNTAPEIIVRRTAHMLGYRFRLHRRDLPGSPDVVFPSRRKVIFVHGCFWHRHPGCKKATTPKTRREFWKEKFRQNKKRDARNIHSLSTLGWKVLVVWECETRDTKKLARTLRTFLR